MTTRTILSGLIWLLLLGPFCSAAEPINCPQTIAVRQELAAPVAGWTPTLDETPHRLAGITFYDGPPAERASLVYDQITRGKAEQTATWLFTPQKDRQIWLACSYAGTAIDLTRSLPRQATRCSVAYDSQQQIAGLPVIRKITCQ
jgi:hypothetical protein